MRYTEGKEQVFHFIQKGFEYESRHHDLHLACEYYGKARECLENLYGKESNLHNFVNLYDYIWEFNREEYRTAILKLADVGELLENLSEQFIVDEFTAWLYENREDLLDETVTKTLNLLLQFDLQFSLENIFMQCLFGGNDMEEVMNRILIDPLGLPRKFHYLLQQMYKDVKSVKNIDPDTKHNFLKLFEFMQNQENRDFSDMDKAEKVEIIKSFYDMAQKSYLSKSDSMGVGGGTSSFMDIVRNRFDYDMIRGMMTLGETDYAEEIFSRLKENDFCDINSEINIKLVECLLEHKKGNKKDAQRILDEIIELENNIVLKTFFMKKEQKKIEFLLGMEYLMKRTAEVCNQIRGAEAAYSLVARTRTLSFDHSSIHLNSAEHKHIILEKQKLDIREKAGEDVAKENEKLIKYFEKISQEIFDFDSIKICRRLTDKQAILEFTIMTDERDWDFYYVFVVTSKSISVINIGKCCEIDKNIDGILKYILDYAVGKHSDFQIRALTDYFNIYKMVLMPIGEILPQSIHQLFIAGAGNFLELPFGLLPCFHWYDKYMEDEYHIRYINSGKEILRDTNYETNQGAIVIGNPDFEGKFPALPSSKREVEVIAELLKVKPITGKEALPECMSQTAGIYHISTHSYTQKADSQQDIDPMKRVGLVFAGGQYLSAQKISKIDMSKTNLVVLSVCGEKEEKGVYSDIGPGIRRAFINAGARHIIINLWKTDDNAAELLMRCFYDYYITEKINIEEALRRAKQYLKTNSASAIKSGKYYDEGMESILGLVKDDEMPYAHPYYWAGFIVLGV